ncbi:hypothetical protein RSAG8_02405, partial [Rhizoctonia solani AG-8 WAC10335]
MSWKARPCVLTRLVAGELGLPRPVVTKALRNGMNGHTRRANMTIETIMDVDMIDTTVDIAKNIMPTTATVETGMTGMTGTPVHVGKTGTDIQIVMTCDIGTMKGAADSASGEVVTNQGDKQGCSMNPKASTGPAIAGAIPPGWCEQAAASCRLRRESCVFCTLPDLN